MRRGFAKLGKIEKLVSALTVVVLMATLGSTLVFAQSSGNYNYAYTGTSTQCTDTSGLLGAGAPVNYLKTGLKVSSGSGVGLIVRPSAVVGLLTNVSLTKTGTASSQAGVNFQVTVTPLSGQAQPQVTPSFPVTYSDRYISISTNLFDAIANACTNIGGCYFNFNETTLSAHSFDWVVDGLSSGDYEVNVTWTPYTNATAPNSAQTCVGPVIITATQGKQFAPSTGISY